MKLEQEIRIVSGNADSSAESDILDTHEISIQLSGTTSTNESDHSSFRPSVDDTSVEGCSIEKEDQLPIMKIKDKDNVGSRCYLIFCRGWYGCHGYSRVIEAWPRTSAFLFGVVVPLFTLVAVALLFGFFLSKLEGPPEIEANDHLLAAHTEAETLVTIVSNFTGLLPQLCIKLYFDNHSILELGPALFDRLVDGALDESEDLKVEQLVNRSLLSIDTEELFTYMEACGNDAKPITSFLAERAANASKRVSGDLSFNWVRCYPGADGLGGTGQSDIWATGQSIEEIRPAAQVQHFQRVWELDRQRIYHETLRESLKDPHYRGSAGALRLAAFDYSIAQASGAVGCELNGVSATWFWFTVMTTIGYGNHAPVTDGGRTMIFTLGFMSVILFGAVLSQAGAVVSAILDDSVKRIRLQVLSWPSVSCLIWGSLYYAWMLVIAFVTQQWKVGRLGEAFPFNEGYWFAFISTTTVGLGDVFLEPEVIRGDDLIVFPPLFLIGFVFFAAFLRKFAEMVLFALAKENKKTLIQSLLSRLESTNGLPTVLIAPGMDPDADNERKDPEESIGV